MPLQARRLRGDFVRRYVFGLAIVAALTAAACLSAFVSARHDAIRTNAIALAADQTATSQQIAYLAHALAAEDDEATAGALRAELLGAVGRMREGHARLSGRRVAAAAERAEFAAISPILLEGAPSLETRLLDFLAAGEAAASAPLGALKAGEPPLSRLGPDATAIQGDAHARIVRALENRATSNADRSAQGALIALGLIVGATAFIGLFGFRPLGARIEETMKACEEAEARTKAAAVEAERANASKSNFLRVISHEIRTPLNAVTGIAQLLSRSQLPPNAAEQVRQLSAASAHLLSLTGNVLDFGKLEAGALELEAEPLNLGDTLGQCVDMISPLAREKGLAVKTELESARTVWVKGDASRLRQAVLNLLSNAVKFTDYGSVSLRCSIVEREDSTAFRIVVSDTGVGIAPEARGQIFRSFEALDAFETRRQGGAGLGLAIVSELVKTMGGNLSLDSDAGQGATFVVALELPRAERPAEAEGSNAAADGPYSVLIVEDNIPNQMIAKAFLKAAGFEVTIANNGQEAIEAVRTARFDLVLMDINMPVMDGLEATRILRQNPDYRTTPILAFTAHAIDEDRSTLLNAGLNDILQKPVTEQGLVERVRQWLAGDAPDPMSDAA